MAVFGSQNVVQREWLSKAKATVVDLVVLAATGTLDYILGWMCEYLFHGNAQNCFAKYRDDDDDDDDAKDQGSRKEKIHQPDDAFGHIHACTPEVIVKHLERLELYKTFQDLTGTILIARRNPSRDKCNLVKSKAKKLLLLVHPDKFNSKHPECAADVSTKATEVIARMFVSAKSKCAS